jgi:hypothetical protein
LEKKYAINGASAPKIANTSIRQPRISLLPRWAQGQRKAKAAFFTTEAQAKEELKKWDRRIPKNAPPRCSGWPVTGLRPIVFVLVVVLVLDF